jgi:hypothetical protein
MSTTPAELGIFTEDGRTSFRPGETLRVSALWALPPGTAALEARLFWYTRGKGSEDLEIVAVERIENAPAAGEKVLTFQLPVQPWTFSGKLISLLWAVELVTEPEGVSARVEFTLSPDGTEILLHAQSEDEAGDVEADSEG